MVGSLLALYGWGSSNAVGQVASQAAARPETNPRIASLLKRMTLEEKVRMCFGGTQPGVVLLPGVPRLGVPGLHATDGPRGVTQAPAATSFPTGISLAASWDPGLLQDVGVVIGQESRAMGKTMIFAPAINIDRDPLDGRFLSTTPRTLI